MKKKSLIMLLCALFVIGGTAFGTIAYLTSESGVTNTFTVGNVEIIVDEAVVDENGIPVTDEEGNELRTEEGNEYHLIPGKTYVKDPTVTVKSGSEPSYVRMLITITHIDKVKDVLGEGFLPENYVEGYDSDIWKCVNIVEDTEMQEGVEVPIATYEFRYYTSVSGTDENGEDADVELASLFTSFEVPKELDGEDLQKLVDMEIRAVGQAIQLTGFEDNEEEAWSAFPAPQEPATPNP